MPTNTIYVDTNNQSELFLFETTEGSTPTLRVYVYNNETAASWTATNTAKFIYAVNREASSMVEVDGTLTAGTNYIDFVFTGAKTAINGKFYCSVIVYDDGGNEIVVQSDGMIILKRNPALDGATTLDTTTTINWANYTNVGPFPWAIGNSVTTYTDCSDSPYDVPAASSSTTFIHNGSCDFVFVLPKATTANIGRTYGFMCLQRAYIITLQCQENDSIDDSPTTGQKFSIRNYGIPCSVMIRQTTATTYHTIWGDGAWQTGAGEVALSSSSSSSSSSVDSSSSTSSSSSEVENWSTSSSSSSG